MLSLSTTRTTSNNGIGALTVATAAAATAVACYYIYQSSLDCDSTKKNPSFSLGWISSLWTNTGATIIANEETAVQSSTIAKSEIPAPLRERFDQCCNIIREETDVPPKVQLRLYGWYKQATMGPIDENTTNVSKPLPFQFEAMAKYKAWKSLGSMPPALAMQSYIDFVVQYQFTKDAFEDEQDDDDLFEKDIENAMKFNGMGLKPSTLSTTEDDYSEGEEEPDGKEPKIEAAPTTSTSTTPTTTTSASSSSSFFSSSSQTKKFPKYALHRAARDNDLSKLSELFQSPDVDPDELDETGQTALHLAADRGHIQVIQLLTQKNANIHVADMDGISILQAAVIAGHLDVCQLLLKLGSNPDQADHDGDTPRSCAFESDEKDIQALFSQQRMQTSSPPIPEDDDDGNNDIPTKLQFSTNSTTGNKTAMLKVNGFQIPGMTTSIDTSALDSIPIDLQDEDEGDI